jgi:hypothetical protein
MRDLENKKLIPVPAPVPVPVPIDYTRIFSFPHEEGAPSLPSAAKPIDKLKYGLEVVKWSRDKHPVNNFKQTAKPGEIDPFEWQMVQAITQINSIDRFDGVDPVQTQRWGQDFFDRVINKSDYEGALQALNDSGSKAAQFQNEIMSGAKEVVRATVTQQLSNYLDRGTPTQTLKQFNERLTNPDDPVQRSAGFNMCQMSTQTSTAVERGTMQRNQAVKIKNDVSSEAAYQKAVVNSRNARADEAKKRRDYDNLMAGRDRLNGGVALAIPGIPNQPEQWMHQFLDPCFTPVCLATRYPK